ncbi:MAG: arylamine N-acetyltransferase [Pirellulales bacterium]
MSRNPLEPPQDGQTLHLFQRHFGIQTSRSDVAALREVIAAFARLPYENLTKIVRESDERGGMAEKRDPLQVVADHIALGGGGTCFSLTATLLHLVRSLGFRAEPILADRRYGANTHCALLVWIDDVPHLVDPGYLIIDPIPLHSPRDLRVETSFNEVLLKPLEGGRRWELATSQQGRSTYRLTFKNEPADTGEFLKAWDASFAWDMMQYPVLTRVAGAQQLYIQGRRYQRRGRDAVEHVELPWEQLGQRMVEEFGISHELVRSALQRWRRSTD